MKDYLKKKAWSFGTLLNKVVSCKISNPDSVEVKFDYREDFFERKLELNVPGPVPAPTSHVMHF